jgi:hypothetical protein
MTKSASFKNEREQIRKAKRARKLMCKRKVEHGKLP